ncbi:MBG domain-containing protein [Furfurilactobacillus milii]|uniref:LPXTG cell wall anchor domain-containing protein n=1 Tax=Furfurilactobacillus milii TaxID=2888272 RepID=A0A6N9I0Y9_9LACO|nr:MBG domain-containing protein [Furfurilactobacillus milii]MYV16043.1 LPXTG cell wall anchor domain-containing protein [Furfurilactobacillus milii]
MLKSKFRHVAEKNHYKMYKAGKTWLFANIVILSLGAAVATSTIKPVKADEEANTDTESPNGSSSAQQNSAVIQSSTKASSISSSADLNKTSNEKSVISSNYSSSDAATTGSQDTSSTKASSEQSKSVSSASQANSQASQTNETSTSVAKKVQAASLASSNTSNSSTENKAAEGSQSATSVSSNDSTNKGQAKSNSSSASADNTQSTAATVSSLQTVQPTSTAPLAKSIATNTAWTDTTTPVVNRKSETSQTMEIATTSSVTVNSASSSVPMSLVAIASSANKNMQTLSLIDPNKFVKGTKIEDSNNDTLIVSLPSGASIEDIRQAKKVLSEAHVKKAVINIIDAATNTDYTTGVDAAISDLGQGFWTGGHSAGGALSDWIGTNIQKPDFTAAQKIISKGATEENLNVATTSAQNTIKNWINNIMSSINWTQIKSSNAFAALGDDKLTNTDIQNGYTDTIREFIKGSLTTEADYLWLVTSTDNTDNSLYYGTQGYNDAGTDSSGNVLPHFATLLNAVNSFSTDTETDSKLKDAYQAGRAMTLFWISGQDSERKIVLSTLNPQNNPLDTDDYGNDTLLYQVGTISGSPITTAGTETKDASTLQNITTGPTIQMQQGIPAQYFITFDKIHENFLANSSNFAVNALTGAASVDNLTQLEKDLTNATFHAYYDEWETIVNDAFAKATSDALAGNSLALNASDAVGSNITYPVYSYNGHQYSLNTHQQALYQNAYRFAKAYLTGHEPKSDNDATTHLGSFGSGNTPLNVITDANSVESPLDLAIYSVLTGTSYTFNTARNGINTENGVNKSASVGTNFQSQGYSDTNADWIATAAQNDMYQIAWNVANQAKLDFLADVQLAVNKGDSAKLADLADMLPSADKPGILTAQQWAYYKQNSYVYYKVFSTLYKGYLVVKDAEDHLVSVIDSVVKDADNYVQQDGDSHYGDPVAQDIEKARAIETAIGQYIASDGKNPQPELTAHIDATQNTILNGDTTYTTPYSEDLNGNASMATVVTPTAQTTIAGTELQGENTAATRTIQNAVDYGYVHEEAMAIPAYEAGYAKVQMTLNVTPADKQSALSGPNDGDTYTFENTSNVTDNLTPVLTTTNPDGSTVWTVNYTNADGSSTIITINRTAPVLNLKPDPATGKLTALQETEQKIGQVTTIETVVNNITAADGSTTSKDSTPQTTNTTSVSYPSIGLHAGVTTDGKENTTVKATVNDDGTVSYNFNRVALNTVTTGTQPAIIDTLKPNVATTSNTDGSTSYSVSYNNADGTTSLVTLNRAKPVDSEKIGDITTMEVVTSGGSLTTPVDTGLIKAPIGTALVTAYPTDPTDKTKLTTISFTPNPDGTIGYRFTNANVASLAAKAKTANVVDVDGTNKGNLYQDGWDYRKSFIAYNTIIQQVADPDFKNPDVTDKNGQATNKLTTDQTYAGFFESKNSKGEVIKNQSVQLIPSSDVNNHYGSYTQKTVTNLDGSYTVVTLYVNGDIGYTVYDTKGNLSPANKQNITTTNPTGELILKANDKLITVTNDDAPATPIVDGTPDSAIVTKPSSVTITRTANDAITISETGVQSTMANKLNVQNQATTADVSVTVGNNVEPSFTSTTIVTPVSALHPGVVFSADTTVGINKDGITSTYDDDGSTNTNGLQYQGTVIDPTGPDINLVKDANGKSVLFNDASDKDTATNNLRAALRATDMSLDYGQARNTTTTLQYVANNVSNAGTGTTATINIDTSTPTLTIALGKYTDGVNAGQVISTSSFDADGVITPAVRAASKDVAVKAASDNIGTAIFDWTSWYQANKAALNNENWTYDDNTKTLTYTPTNKADIAALLAAATNGPITINWSGAKDATRAAMVDKYGDVMNLVITANVKSENAVTKDVNVSTTDVTNNQYTFTHEALEKLVNSDPSKPSDPNDLVTKFIEKWATSAGSTSRTYTGTMNGMPLPQGVAAVTLKSDGDIVVTYDDDEATSNYKVKTNTNVIKLVLPFTVDAKGDKYVPDETLKKKQTTDATSTTSNTGTDTTKDSTDNPVPPLAGLTLNMNMQGNVTVAYKAAAGGANTTVKQNDQSTNVSYAATGTDIKTAYTLTNAVLGSTYTVTVPATIAADKTANFDGATYKLINGTATNDPTAVKIDNATVEFGTNDKTYLYAKTVGVIQGVTPNKPTVTVNKTAAIADGVTETIDLSKEAADYDWNTVTFTPDANTSTKYDVKTVVNKAAKTVTVTFTPKTRADDLDFMADAYQEGLPLNGWLTDQKTVTGSTTPVLNNALYVETKAEPALENYTKAATIDVSKSGSGYDATAHTYTFDVPTSALSTQELTLLAQGQNLVLTNDSSATDVAKGYSSYSSDNWGSVKSMTISLNTDGTAHVVATLDTSSTPESSLQNGAILIAGTSSDSPADSGIHLALTLTNDLTQNSTGLPAGITKPVYPDLTGKNLKSTDDVTSKPVAGYVVTGATFNGTAVPASELKMNADGTATYTATHGWGDNSGATVADNLVWTYGPAKVAATIGTQSKFYGMTDPTTPYTVTGLSSWLKAPAAGWQSADFTRTYAKTNTANDPTQDPVGDYTVTLSDQGIKDLQAANPDYTITDATGKSTVDKIVAGKLTINPAPIKSTTQDTTRVYSSKSIAADSTNSDGSAYVPTEVFTSSNPKSTVIPKDLQLTDSQDYDYFLADGTTPIAASAAKNVGTYVWKLNAAGKKVLYQRLGNVDGDDKNLNFLLSDDSLESGKYTITADPLDVAVNNGIRDYNGNDIGTDDSSTDKKDFTNITFKNQKSDTTKVPDSISLDPKTDFTYKDAKGDVVPYTSVKDAGTYTWTVNDTGKAKIDAQLGEVKDASGKVTQAANFSIDDTQLTGTYTINKVAVTIAAPTLKKTYDGNAYTGTDDAATVTGKPANGAALTYSLTDISSDKDVGSYPMTITAKDTDNPNYTITVTAGLLEIDPQALTTAKPNTPTNPANPSVPNDNKPKTDTPQAKKSLTIIGATKVYDGTAASDPTTYTVEGPSDYSTFTIPKTFTAADFDTTGINSQNVGSYAVKLSAAGLKKLRAANLNFTVDDDDIQDGLFTITPRPVSVTVKDQTKSVGATDPTLTATTGTVVGKSVSGLVKGDTLNYTLSRARGETPGDYAISVTDGTNPNYTLTDTGGKLSITPVVTLHIEDQDGKPIAGESDTSLTSTDKPDTTVTVTQKSINGYTIEIGQPTSYTITSDSQQTVTLKYRKNASVIANYFLVGTDTPIAKSKTTDSGVGLAYTTTALDLTGYTLVATPQNASGTLGDTNKPVNYYYTVDYTPVIETPSGKTPIGYTPPVKPQTGTGTPGEPVNSKTSLPKIPGYTVTTVPNVPDKPGQVKVVYTPETETVTVHYYVVNSSTPVDGNSTVTLTGDFGDSYQTQAKSFSGYRLVAMPTNADGTYQVGGITVNYYYCVVNTVQPADPHAPTTTGFGTPVSPIDPDGGIVPTDPVNPDVPQVTPTQMPNYPDVLAANPVDPPVVDDPSDLVDPVSTPVEQVESSHGIKLTEQPMTQLRRSHAPRHAATAGSKQRTSRLPQTGEQNSSSLVVAGLSIITSSLALLGIKKYRHKHDLGSREDETGRKF